MSQNHGSPNSSVAQSVLGNSLSNIAVSLNTNPHNMSMHMQNNHIPNKPLNVHGGFPTTLNEFPGLASFPAQQGIHRNAKGNTH